MESINEEYNDKSIERGFQFVYIPSQSNICLHNMLLYKNSEREIINELLCKD